MSEERADGPDAEAAEGGFIRRHVWRHRWRRIGSIAGIVVLLAALFYGGGGWFFSGIIEKDALVVTQGKLDYPIKVTGVTDDTISLEVVGDLGDDQYAGEQWERDLWVGVGTAHVSGVVGPAIERTETTATRRYIPPVVGELAPGDRVRLNVRAYWPNPTLALDQDFRTVAYEDSLGEFPSWLIPGENDEVWAVYVHGKGSNQVEPMRIETSLRAEGLTGLNIRYRNDEDAPHVSGDIARYGQTEWEDLNAAVELALDRGAERFVLVGTSMGGSIVLGFMKNSEHADKVDALILDSPATDIGGIIRHGAADTPLIPGVVNVGPGLTWSAMTIASQRFDISWSDTDYNEIAGDLEVPMLIWAAEEDDIVPIETIEGFVDNADPNLVQFERITNPEASHLMSWNVDPDRYDSVTRAFIREHVAAPARAAAG